MVQTSRNRRHAGDAGTVVVRDAATGDADAITAIANQLLATTTDEWTETPHTVEDRVQWLASQQAVGWPVLVAQQDGEVVGWASYGDFRDSARWPGYRITVEHSVHVRADHWKSGIGRALMTALVERARAAGKHVMVGAIDGANLRSIGFHERLDF